MQIGPLFIGWVRLEENDRIAHALDPWPAGWEGLHVELNGRGLMIVARPKEGVEL